MVLIWNDYWLPSREMVKVTSKRVPIVDRVCDLFLPYLNCSNSDLIRSIFSKNAFWGSHCQKLY